MCAGETAQPKSGLQRFSRSRAEAHPDRDQAIEALSQAAERIERTTTLGGLLGLEGSATARYFSGLRSLFAPSWGFTSRQRRPPPDPINGLLSFGYTLLAHKVRGAVESVGFDPHLGYLHQVDYGRPSLALDLMEEFRPLLVDALVLRICSDGLVQPSDFTATEEGGVQLSDDGRRRFVTAFEERMRTEALHPEGAEHGPGKVSYIRCLNLQARRLARAVREEGYQYQAFVAR